MQMERINLSAIGVKMWPKNTVDNQFPKMELPGEERFQACQMRQKSITVRLVDPLTTGRITNLKG
jgi:hypothetical protein